MDQFQHLQLCVAEVGNGQVLATPLYLKIYHPSTLFPSFDSNFDFIGIHGFVLSKSVFTLDKCQKRTYVYFGKQGNFATVQL